jgi:hypothetical protein
MHYIIFPRELLDLNGTGQAVITDMIVTMYFEENSGINLFP